MSNHIVIFRGGMGLNWIVTHQRFQKYGSPNGKTWRSAKAVVSVPNLNFSQYGFCSNTHWGVTLQFSVYSEFSLSCSLNSTSILTRPTWLGTTLHGIKTLAIIDNKISWQVVRMIASAKWWESRWGHSGDDKRKMNRVSVPWQRGWHKREVVVMLSRLTLILYLASLPSSVVKYLALNTEQCPTMRCAYLP